MDIWVRSQLGDILTKVDSMYIEESNCMNISPSGINTVHMFDIVGRFGDDRYRLGSFKAYKDSKKVMDDFNHYVVMTHNAFLKGSIYFNIASDYYMSFQIPEDKDV